MVSPKYSNTHIFPSFKALTSPPHTVSLYVDYNCPFSAKIFLKFRNSVIPAIQKKHPGKFQFVFMNVVQPWHPNSIYTHEFLLSVAKLIREKGAGDAELFWSVSESLFKNIVKFYDNANSDKGRNTIYKEIYDIVSGEVELPFSQSDILDNLVIPQVLSESDYSNHGNLVGIDLKYFTRYHRTVGVHVTPTVAVNGIINGSIESSTEPDKVVEILETNL